jgi:protein-S-isoprenylcysteine O-methyltransferase Ste14
MSEKRIESGAEFPQSDRLQLVMLILFFVLWGLDSLVFQFSTFLAVSVPVVVRLVLAAVSFGFALLLLILSHRMVFNRTRGSLGVLDTGIYGSVRHPLYLGTLLIYVGFTLATFSLLSFVVWIGIFLLYDKMATYEEEDLIRLLGDSYRNYRKNVPKWLPRIRQKAKRKNLAR